MKLVRCAGATVVALFVAALVFFPSAPASGQNAANPFGVDPALAPGQDFYTPQLISPQGGQDPEMQKLLAAEGKSQREADGLVKEYTRKDNEREREAVKLKLADVLGKQFDAQQKRRDAELARLEAQVKKLRDLMKKRGDARQSIVNNRLDQLIRDADGLGWSAPPGIVPQANGFTPLLFTGPARP